MRLRLAPELPTSSTLSVVRAALVPGRRVCLGALVGALLLGGVAGGCGERFTAGEGGGGAGAATSSGTTATGSGTAGTGGTTASGTGGQGASTTGAPGGGGGSPAECHGICETGLRMHPGCGYCVASLCSDADHQYCCLDTWDTECIHAAEFQCGLDCSGANGSPLPCDEQYGGSPAVTEWCQQSIDECVFVLESPVESCELWCGGHGGRCLEATEASGGCAGAFSGSPVPCITMLPAGQLVCTCTHGCLHGPPCEPGRLCTDTGCLGVGGGAAGG